MPLQPHQERVVAEKKDLDEKIAKLSAFFDTETFAKLPDVDKGDLERQMAFMQGYSDTLGLRINRF